MSPRTRIRLGLSLFCIQAVGSTAILMAAREDFGGPDIYKAAFYVLTVMLLSAIALNQVLMRKVLGWWSVLGVASCALALYTQPPEYPLALVLFSLVCWGLAAWQLLVGQPANQAAGQ